MKSTSLPVRGAWIEISWISVHLAQKSSLPVRGAWIEISWIFVHLAQKSSLPVRGAWIEIMLLSGPEKLHFVAPRKGSVD